MTEAVLIASIVISLAAAPASALEEMIGSRGDGACRVALDSIATTSHGQKPTSEERARLTEAAWLACNGPNVTPDLEAKVAMQYWNSHTAGSREGVLVKFQETLARFREAPIRSVSEAQLLERIASLQQELGQAKRAEATLAEALSKRASYFGPKSVEAAFGMVYVGRTKTLIPGLDKQELAKAVAMVEEGVGIVVNARGANDPTAVRARMSTIELYRRLGDEAKAKQIEDWYHSVLDRQSRDQVVEADLSRVPWKMKTA